MSDSICFNSSGLSKSTTFLTSAIALSNATAGFTSSYKLVPNAAISIICAQYEARLARFACFLDSMAASAVCLERRVSKALPSADCSLVSCFVSTPACFRVVDNSLKLILFCWYAVLASAASFLALRKLLVSCFDGLSVCLIAVASFFTSASAVRHCWYVETVSVRNFLNDVMFSLVLSSAFIALPNVPNCFWAEPNAPLNPFPSSAPIITDTAV